jgi:hypothetical protein
MIEVSAGLTSKTVARLVCPEGMLHPGLANLLKAVVVARSAAHSIEIVRDERMSCLGQREKTHDLVAGVAGRGAHSQAYLGAAAAKLFQSSEQTNISGDDIRPLVKTFRSALLRWGGGISRTVAQEQKQQER